MYRQPSSSNRPFDEKEAVELVAEEMAPPKLQECATFDTDDEDLVDLESGAPRERAGSAMISKLKAAISDGDDEDDNDDRTLYSIPNDVYTLFFVSQLGGTSCLYSVYVFGIKLALYTFLALDTYSGEAMLTSTDKTVLAAQFLMIPIAVAMQTDLIDTFQIVANVKYDAAVIRKDNPAATQVKYQLSALARFVDGAYSLMVNFVVICSAQHVLELFLNFAALHFLQDIDNVALDLAAKGYLSDAMQQQAAAAEAAHLPKRGRRNWLRSLDTVLFGATLLLLFATWTAIFVVRR